MSKNSGDRRPCCSGQKVPSKQHVLNLLGRLVELPPPAPIDAPQALVLKIEPLANVTRYDSLREVRHVA